MKKCIHCSKRFWFWQELMLWYKSNGKYIYRHRHCRTAYEAGYVVGRVHGEQDAKESHE